MKLNFRSKNIGAGIIWLILFLSCAEKSKNPEIVPLVEVRYENNHAQLYRNGLPYHIQGGSGTEYLEKLSLYGGNSIRTWSLYNAKELLDEAHKYGITVTLGLEIGRPYWGENFNYWNLFAVDKKIEELRPTIEEFKDHPALLMWGVGNEVALAGGQRDLVYYVINRVAKMVKEVDPNHPTMTAIPSQFIGRSKYLMSDIDILGYNGFRSLEPFYIQNKNYGRSGWGRAYLYTEWGPPGHWEVNDTEWGAPLEMKTQEKLAYMEKNWNLMNQDSIAFLGSYSFYWGYKYEITHTWFSHFSEDGLEAESIDFLKSAWNGEPFENSAPTISEILINNQLPKLNLYLKADSAYSAKPFIDFQEQDSLTYKWEIRPEESKFHEVDKFHYNMKYLMEDEASEVLEFKAPKDEGPYRLFLFVKYDEGKFASKNIPFYVINR